MISGKTLIELGFKSSKWFNEVIEHANRYGLQGDQLKTYVNSILPKIVLPHEESLAFIKNIRAESPEEVSNIKQVEETMREVMKTPTVVSGAIMPDACPAGGKGQIPVGGIVKTKNAIHPAMHSADICCSVMISNLGMVDPKKVLDNAHSVTHFGGGGRKDLFKLDKNLETKISKNRYLKHEKSLNLARTHLGTQGDGNHFLFVGTLKSTGETAMITHHGSRGFGANLYSTGMKVAETFRKEMSPKTLPINAWIPYDTIEGETYWDALQIIREWTKLNHCLIHNATCQKMRINPVNRFWNEHNFVFKEEQYFYHAKGATPLDDKFVPDSQNGLRLIPLNMSEPVLIVKGASTNTNLGLAPHGAGRNISRTRHKKNKSNKTAEQVFREETFGIDVRFFSNKIDISELPSAYKNAQHVKSQMAEFGLGKVVDEVLPFGCIMAGDWQIDASWKRKAQKNRPTRDLQSN